MSAKFASASIVPLGSRGSLGTSENHVVVVCIRLGRLSACFQSHSNSAISLRLGQQWTIQNSAGLRGEHSSRLFQVRSPRFLHRQETLTNTPGIHHDNTSTWLFPSPHGGRHAFRVSYDDISPTSRSLFTIRDLPFFTPTHSAFPSALNAFLHQFNNVSFRWKNDYEPLTADLLRLCSQYQEGILSLLPVPPKDLAGGETLIALALRCVKLQD